MADHEGVLFGLGSPLLDIVAVVDQQFLDKYDIKVRNAILAEEDHLPMYNEISEKFKVEYIAGGAALNSIKIAQWMLQIPGATSYIGCIGKDKFGEELKNSSKAVGVKVHYCEDETYPTGTCAVCLVGAERSFVANLSAAGCYSPDHLLKEENWALVKKANYIFVAGYFVTVSPESILLLAEHSAAYNKVFALNLSAPFICQFFKDVLEKVLPYVDYIFAGEAEAKTFSNENGWETENIEEIALMISAMPKESGAHKRVTVITRGSDPVVVAEDGKVKSFPVVLFLEEEIVDKTGEGDAFVGGFLSQLVQEKTIEECVKAGNYAAGVVIRRSGCTFPEKPDFEMGA